MRRFEIAELTAARGTVRALELGQRRRDLERARVLIDESYRLHDNNNVAIERTFGLMDTTGALGAIARETGELDRAAMGHA